MIGCVNRQSTRDEQFIRYHIHHIYKQSTILMGCKRSRENRESAKAQSISGEWYVNRSCEPPVEMLRSSLRFTSTICTRCRSLCEFFWENISRQEGDIYTATFMPVLSNFFLSLISSSLALLFVFSRSDEAYERQSVTRIPFLIFSSFFPLPLSLSHTLSVSRSLRLYLTSLHNF